MAVEFPARLEQLRGDQMGTPDEVAAAPRPAAAAPPTQPAAAMLSSGTDPRWGIV
jgi:hypothetical protein